MNGSLERATRTNDYRKRVYLIQSWDESEIGEGRLEYLERCADYWDL